MSRKMIEYEVADGKITSIDGYKVGGGGDATTKQDKLYTKANSGITLTEEEGKSYIGSQLVYTRQVLDIYPVFRAGTYAIGDAVETLRYNLDGGLFIGEEYRSNAKTIIKIDDVIMLRVVRPEAGSGGNPTAVVIIWYAIQGGTIKAQQQPETYVPVLLIPKGNCERKL